MSGVSTRHASLLLPLYNVVIRKIKQVLDRTNPLTQIVHGRKLSYLGPGGLTGRTASFRIRDIHPSHYGRICPIDTSDGINVKGNTNYGQGLSLFQYGIFVNKRLTYYGVLLPAFSWVVLFIFLACF
ncbi:RNA polymerase Rpb2 domain 3 protein [Medicago truncatula]|uniref:DNA-directed RNA polymerase n=1 Tax=Medicago truncatula TaxID=3880 RepID=G7JKY2_MEDTR|nr:RNA polymerase Rpb2 domain 3 protein [Medicago truncatula]